MESNVCSCHCDSYNESGFHQGSAVEGMGWPVLHQRKAGAGRTRRSWAAPDDDLAREPCGTSQEPRLAMPLGQPKDLVEWRAAGHWPWAAVFADFPFQKGPKTPPLTSNVDAPARAKRSRRHRNGPIAHLQWSYADRAAGIDYRASTLEYGHRHLPCVRRAASPAVRSLGQPAAPSYRRSNPSRSARDNPR